MHVDALPSEDETQKKSGSEKPKEPKSPALKPRISHLPFRLRFAKARLDAQLQKFPDVPKKLHVRIPSINALSQIPMYAKFLKEILS